MPNGLKIERGRVFSNELAEIIEQQTPERQRVTRVQIEAAAAKLGLRIVPETTSLAILEMITDPREKKRIIEETAAQYPPNLLIKTKLGYEAQSIGGAEWVSYSFSTIDAEGIHYEPVLGDVNDRVIKVFVGAGSFLENYPNVSWQEFLRVLGFEEIIVPLPEKVTEVKLPPLSGVNIFSILMLASESPQVMLGDW